MHEAREVKRSHRKKDFQKVKKRKSESFLEFLPEGKLEKFSLEKAQPKIPHFCPSD